LSLVEIRACGGVIHKKKGDDHYILLIRKRNSTIWSLPKGHKKNNESDQDTALREVKEETGFTCLLEGKIGEINFQYHKKGQDYRERVVYYAMAPDQKTNIIDTNEIDEIRWFSLYDADKQLYYQNERDILNNFFKSNPEEKGIDVLNLEK
jgi:8-oxo-dGTP pyrophosphatase MutT (NUDIX family)